MDWLQLARVLAALILVVGLVALVSMLLRRYGTGTRSSGGRRGRRLALIETLPLDARRRLVLIRRDDQEHLLLLGATDALVVETRIPQPGFEARLAENARFLDAPSPTSAPPIGPS